MVRTVMSTLEKPDTTIERLNGLIERIRNRFPQANLGFVELICDYAKAKYANLYHPLGEPYIEYVCRIADLLLDLYPNPILYPGLVLNFDPVIISAALVYPISFNSTNLISDFKNMAKGKEETERLLIEELIKINEEIKEISNFELNYTVKTLTDDETENRKLTLEAMYEMAINEMQDESQALNTPLNSHFQKETKQIKNLIGMFLAAITDNRALIIKLADRLLLMRRLIELIGASDDNEDSPEVREKKSPYLNYVKITLAIYAPLADQLGIWRFKSELEDLSFKFLQPQKYREIASKLNRQQQEKDINDFIPQIKAKMEEYSKEYSNIVSFSFRAKHIYSIYKKILERRISFEQINDFLGIRIIIEDNDEDKCYIAQAIISESWSALDLYDGKTFVDWIAKPKPNKYQSLHITIKIYLEKDGVKEEKIVEVQIRTRKMDEIAEHGMDTEEEYALNASHKLYKGNPYRKGETAREIGIKDLVWNQQLAKMSWAVQKHFAPKYGGGDQENKKRRHGDQENKKSPLSPIQKRTSKDRIFVITPKGDVIDIPAGATPLDFAYRIHTDIGHTYLGAKVNGRFVRIEYSLKNGDIVEIVTSRTRKGPNPDWLSKKKLTQQEIDDLKEILEMELKSLNRRLDEKLKDLKRKQEKIEQKLKDLNNGSEEQKKSLEQKLKDLKKRQDNLEKGREKILKEDAFFLEPFISEKILSFEWLFLPEKKKSNRKKSRAKDESEDEQNYMLYVFARTHQARSKIANWMNKQNNENIHDRTPTDNK